MWRRLFNIATIVSLLLCLVSGVLWARSSGHFEKFSLHYNRWPAKTEVRSYHLDVVWDCRRILRAHINHWTFTAADFAGQPRPSTVLKQTRAGHPPGLKCSFLAPQSHPWMAPEFPFTGTIDWRSSAVKHGHYWKLSVRLWLPTLLSGVLPAIWIYRWRRSKEHPWQFSMREFLMAFTVLAILLGLGIRLAN